MRGLAFPPNADADREASYEYGTPISNVDDIPIDPALSGATIDPVLMMEDGAVDVLQPQPEKPLDEHAPVMVDDFSIPQYSGAPEGDPFAQQMPVPYFPIPQEQPTPPLKPKRKRKVRKETICSFCRRGETKNKHEEPEILLTCHECGRSGHPSCMQLEGLTDVVRTYPWKCLECKNCEVCQEKGDDARILFCDGCDRGWHLDCMVPPLEEPPDGKWHCPGCPPVEPEANDQVEYPPEEDAQHIPVDVSREGSVASTSRSTVEVPVSAKVSRRRKKAVGKGKSRASRAVAAADDFEEEEQVDVDVDETPVAPSRPRGRARKSTGSRRKSPPPPSSDEEVAITPIRSTKRRRAPPREPSPPPPTALRVRLRLPAQRGKGKEREEEEPPRGLFDDILGLEERDVSKTTILNSDKVYFERSRLAAEEKLAPPVQPAASSSSRTLESTDYFSITGRPRPLRSATLQHQALSTPLLPSRIQFSNSPGPSTPGGAASSSVLPKFEHGVLRIRTIRFGPYDIKTWYDAPFPEEYANIPDGRMWICEFCLKYMKSRFGATRHQMKCKARHPPGDEIYRDGAISIFEVDGRRNKIYCQNLCLLSKMFLDHKSLFYDVEPFLFYVITQVDDFGARFVGYFSKEKRCPKDYNLSCIMTLPVRQRQGWGNLLIDFSYLLSKIEQRLGSPEKPLSSLGALGYKAYWTLAVMRFLQFAPDNVRLEDICAGTSMLPEDVCNTLIQQNMIFIPEPEAPVVRPSPGQAIKFPKGRKNGVARRSLHRMQTQDKETMDGHGDTKAPFVPPRHYEIHFDREKVEEYLRNWEAKGYVKLKPEKLQWTPYLTSRIPQEANLPLLPAMDTVPDESSKAGSMQPLTPRFPKEGLASSPAAASRTTDGEDADERDELPMVTDTPSPEIRTRRRPSMKLQAKEKEPPPSLRTTRSHRAVTPPVTPMSRSRSLRTRSSIANIPPPPVEEPRSTRRGLATRKSSSRKVEVNNDEAFAARLAMEEMQQGRQLRSRRSESQVENKRPVVVVPTPTKPVPPARKRRRIDSSPEVVEDVAPRAPSEEPKDEEDVQKEDDDEPMDVDVALPNGRALETQTPEHTDTTLVEVNNASAEEESAVAKEVLDVKSEDAGTPLTSLTSRQSVPSDDTVFMADLQTAGGGGKDKFGSYHEGSTVAVGTMDLDDCHDEDADGEYEDDAEGSPDPEAVGY